MNGKEKERIIHEIAELICEEVACDECLVDSRDENCGDLLRERLLDRVEGNDDN